MKDVQFISTSGRDSTEIKNWELGIRKDAGAAARGRLTAVRAAKAPTSSQPITQSTNHQSFINHHSSIINAQSSIINHPFIDDHCFGCGVVRR
jgi:hypothetical protein